MLLWSRWWGRYDDEQLEWDDPWPPSCSFFAPPSLLLRVVPLNLRILLINDYQEYPWESDIQCPDPLRSRISRQPSHSPVHFPCQSALCWPAIRECMKVSELLYRRNCDWYCFFQIWQVDPSKLPCLAQWKRDYTMETVLLEIRRWNPLVGFLNSGLHIANVQAYRYMALPQHKKLPQPPEGTNF